MRAHGQTSGCARSWSASGSRRVHAARDAIFEQTERIERAAVAAIPDGVYEAEGCIDNDGLDDTPVSIRVKVTVEGERLEIDLSGTDDMQRGPVNCGARAGGLGLPRRVQDADRLGAAAERRRVPPARGEGARRARCSRPRSRRRARGTSRRSAC